MNNRVFWGVIALAVAGMFAAASIGDAARRMPNRDGVLIAGHDGVDQQMVLVDSDGNVSIEQGATASAFTVGGAAADDAAASGNPVPIGCMFETTTDAVDNNDIARVNCSAEGAIGGGLFNGTTFTSAREVVAATDSTGVGIAAAGILAQFDDASVGTVTENQFSNLRMGSDRSLYVAGAVASGATDSGNPVKVGGVYSSTLPTLTNGQRGNLQLESRGTLLVTAAGSNGALSTVSAGTDGLGNVTSLVSVSQNFDFNGSSWDKRRANTDITVLASAARVASVNSSDITNYNGTGVHVVIDATAETGTADVTCTIQGKDALSGQYYTILAAAVISGVETRVLRVFPGSTVTANLAANDIMPRTWRVSCTAADADSLTYSIGASVIL